MASTIFKQAEGPDAEFDEDSGAGEVDDNDNDDLEEPEREAADLSLVTAALSPITVNLGREPWRSRG